MKKYLNIGKIIKLHGLKGEVCVNSCTDFPNIRFKKKAIVYLFKKNEIKKLIINSCKKKKKNIYILSFINYLLIDYVKNFINCILKIKISNFFLLKKKDSFFYYQIIGLKVFDNKKKYYGKIINIFKTGSNDVWVVKNFKKEILIPYIDEFVLKVDLINKKIYIINNCF